MCTRFARANVYTLAKAILIMKGMTVEPNKETFKIFNSSSNVCAQRFKKNTELLMLRHVLYGSRSCTERIDIVNVYV